MKRFIVFALVAFTGVFANAQDSTAVLSDSALAQIDTNLIQISGVVINEETLDPLSYTTVYDKTIGRGVISDYYGYFSTIVFPGDTLIFSYFGFQTSTYIVPDTLSEKRYSIIHLMQQDTLNLPEITVYPWPSREDFARAFIEMRPYDDDITRAQRELSGESLAFVAARLEGDASLAYGNTQNQYLTQIYTNRQLPANNLFNPYAWSKLIKDWKEGKLSRE
mmetsp:Transcript_27962/g.37323  ORF Transcript_27962/g.37323 Transcript_27962/m.37323 type:complete len:221 (+) Transcript_27962:375-1037(+)|eukprot:CAMPEP_0185599902 /NCGR_PEP_ID=MMETSP0434-20130131/83025_1 /TAXON_ID=626734 ORGANISM="Favella taraikaensis, Strain Fe Narragansett Bay" /NCGR_SAMPLE_ID=MMETSP0434 /ASSEMBLY_ACC=CAM_ASM_000379 /LENGTH=220 /DNA_ID=CAMNT_0028229477 /DNA_START=388 /DNA_END=1050 /DNA_ORIENTATION=+